MFGIGFWEIIVIIVVALIAWGPEQLVGQVKKVANFLMQIKKYGTQIMPEVHKLTESIKSSIEVDEFEDNEAFEYIDPPETNTNEKPENEEETVFQ